jgi:hypothetical protein
MPLVTAKPIQAKTAHGGVAAAPVRWTSARGGHQSSRPGWFPGRRSRRVADAAWPLADAVLASRKLSNLVVLLATLAVAALYARDGGVNGLIVNLPGLAVIWSAAYGLLRLGYGWRGIRPRSSVTPGPALPAVRWQRARSLKLLRPPALPLIAGKGRTVACSGISVAAAPPGAAAAGRTGGERSGRAAERSGLGQRQ